MEFKEGDRVKAVERVNGMAIGSEGTIGHISESVGYPIFVDWGNGAECYCKESELELLIPKTKLKADKRGYI